MKRNLIKKKKKNINNADYIYNNINNNINDKNNIDNDYKNQYKNSKFITSSPLLYNTGSNVRDSPLKTFLIVDNFNNEVKLSIENNNNYDGKNNINYDYNYNYKNNNNNFYDDNTFNNNNDNYFHNNNNNNNNIEEEGEIENKVLKNNIFKYNFKNIKIFSFNIVKKIKKSFQNFLFPK
jgi:hypothetical protein